MGTTLNYAALSEAVNASVFDRPAIPDLATMPSHGELAAAMRKTATWVRTAPESERIHGHLRDHEGRFCALGKLIQLTDAPLLARYLPMIECDQNLITLTFDRSAYELCAAALDAMASFLEALSEIAAEDEAVEDSLAESRELALV